jgi:Peptidase family M49
MKKLVFCVLLSVPFLISGCKKKDDKGGKKVEQNAKSPKVARKSVKKPLGKKVVKKSPVKVVKKDGISLKKVIEGVKKFKIIELGYPENELKPEYKPIITKLIQAGFIMDSLFTKQVYGKNSLVKKAIEDAIKKDSSKKPYMDFYKIMYGPWDRTNHNKAFWGDIAKPLGAGYYGDGITKEMFNKEVESIKADIKKIGKTTDKVKIEKKKTLKRDLELLTSYYTVIERKDGKLVGIPYHQYYKTELVAAAKLLNEAAALSKEATLKKYLTSRAKALLNDDYRESDFAWLKISGDIEVVIGPYEVYEDKMNGFKAAYESFITLVDQKYSKKLKEIAKYAGELDKNLPYGDKFREVAAKNLPIKVVNILYTAGDTKAGVQTLAFNLPNDPLVRNDKKKGGYKLVLLKNVAEAKFKAILTPIAKKLINPEQVKYVTFNAFFSHTLFHESAHGIGPSYAQLNGKKIKIREFMKELGSSNEEAKADIAGLLGMEYLGKKKKEVDVIKAGYVTFVASIFRSVRFGASEAHGKANLMAFNWFIKDGAIVFDSKKGTFSIDFEKISKSSRSFVKEILKIQTSGSYKMAKEFDLKWGKISPLLKKALGGLSTIPVDIKSIFKVVKDLGLKDPRD